MNNTDVITYDKVMLPLRQSPQVYKSIREKVNLKKEKNRGYSINEYLTELVMKDLGK